MLENYRKLILPIFLTVFSILFTFVAIYWKSNSFLESQEREFALKAKRTSDALEAQIFERYADSQALALNPTLREALESKNLTPAIAAMNRFASLYKVYQAVVLTDKKGNVVATNSVSPSGNPFPTNLWQQFRGFSLAEWAKHAGENKTLVQEWTNTELREKYFGKSPIHSYSSLVTGKNGEPIGAVTNFADGLLVEREMQLVLKKFKELYNYSLKIYLLDENNDCIALFSEQSIEYFPKIVSLPALASNLGVTYKDNSVFSSSQLNTSQVPGFPKWTIVIEANKNTFLTEIRNLRWIANILAAFILAMFFYSISIFYKMQISHRKEMSLGLVQAQESERTRISREIHDEIGQNLSAMKIHLNSMGKKLPANLGEDLTNVQTVLTDTIESVRRVSHDLHPSILENLGLVAAIQWKIENFVHDTGVQAQLVLDHKTDLADIPKPLAAHLYRIVLEAINNSYKHADASELKVQITRSHKLLTLEVMDNGVGFSDKSKKAGLGLRSIRERASLCGGKAIVRSVPDEGTRIICEIPFLA